MYLGRVGESILANPQLTQKTVSSAVMIVMQYFFQLGHKE